MCRSARTFKLGELVFSLILFRNLSLSVDFVRLHTWRRPKQASKRERMPTRLQVQNNVNYVLRRMNIFSFIARSRAPPYQIYGFSLDEFRFSSSSLFFLLFFIGFPHIPASRATTSTIDTIRVKCSICIQNNSRNAFRGHCTQHTFVSLQSTGDSHITYPFNSSRLQQALRWRWWKLQIVMRWIITNDSNNYYPIPMAF